MNKKVMKTAFAAVCVVAAGMGGLKAYNVANQSQANMLLAENIDALCAGDGADGDTYEDDLIMCIWIANNMCTSAPGSGRWCNVSYGSATYSVYQAFYDTSKCPYYTTFPGC